MSKHKCTIVYSLSLIFFVSIVFFVRVYPLGAEPSWTFFEESYIVSDIDGVVTQGSVFNTESGNAYIVTDFYHFYEYAFHPRVLVFWNGFEYKLFIEGFNQELICRLMDDVQ